MVYDVDVINKRLNAVRKAMERYRKDDDYDTMFILENIEEIYLMLARILKKVR